MAAGKFEISKDKAGKFRWHLKAANGEISAASAGRSGRTQRCARNLTGLPYWLPYIPLAGTRFDTVEGRR
ncbi:MAG: hypothetical protein QOD10_3300 [Mycobacterium sp.]|jgi:hypothetical protein|nr:hypothetical protein [Mycobacterium sp.]